MTFKSHKINILVLLLVLSSELAFGSETVRVVPEIDQAVTAFSVVQAGGQSPILNLDISSVSINPVNLDSKEFQQVQIAEGEHLAVGGLSEDGKPDLPSLSTMMIIPDQAGVSLTVSYSGYDDIDDIDIAPVQPSPLESEPNQDIPFTKDDNTYSQDAFYPGQLAEVSDPIIMRDIRAAQVSMYPVQYNPVSKKLRIYRDLSVQLSYSGEIDNPKTQRRPNLSDAFYPLYKSLFANFDEVFANAEVRRGGYMIICKAAIADSLKAMAMWKHQKGYTTRIVPTTEINSGGNPTKTQIFNYIQNAYQTWEVPPEYVVLAGDVGGSLAIADYPYSTYTSDQKYGCVDGTDYFPDIFIGRMSVNTAFQISMTTAKAIKYEKYPNMDDPGRYLRGLSVGFILFQTARTMTLWVRHLALMHGYTQVDTIYASTHNQNLITLMNTAPGLTWYRGEAFTEGWWGPDYYISDLNAMPNNQKLSILFPVACGMGDFLNECMGEIWTRMGLSPDSLKGGPCFYGTTDHGCHTRWNNPHFVGFFWALFEQNNFHFAPATVAGKMQNYRMHPRYINNGNIVQQYFNTFNIIGDPDTEIRTAIPILLTVTHQDTIPLGINHLELNVIDTAGNVIPDAFVTLIKGADSAEEVFSVAKTDEMGNASLSFNAITPGDMILTVTGRNLYPYQGPIAIINSDLAVGCLSYSLNDDQLGYSSGNNDSLANPGETLEIYPTIKNYGNSQTATGVSATISAIEENEVDIYEATRDCGDLAPGESRAIALPFVIHLRPDLEDGQDIRLKMTITDNVGHSWDSEFEIPIVAPKLAVSNIAIHDSNNRLNRGDTVQVVFSLTNQGHAEAHFLGGKLVSNDDFISVLGDSGFFGDIAIDSTGSNLISPMIISASDAAFPGRSVHLSLQTTSISGATQSIPIQINVDSTILNTDPTGPDAYGYYIYDNRDSLYSERPIYNWVEIVPGLGGQGTRLNFGANLDDYSIPVTLPFEFQYYGEAYGAIIVSTNGFVSPDTSSIDMHGNHWAEFFNAPIPDPGNARAQISPYWDDLGISNSGNYGIFTWNDSTNHRYVIEWSHTTCRNTSAVETFELIIYDPAFYPTLTGDAKMLFQYSLIHDTDIDENYSTVGIENWDQNIGLQYLFDHAPSPGSRIFSTDSTAIMVTTNTGLGGISGAVNLSGSESDAGAIVRISQDQRRVTSDSGLYWFTNVLPGIINIYAEAPGYLPQYLIDINVPANRTLLGYNFELQPCPIPTGLVASDSLAGRVELAWNTLSEPYFMGYYIYRSHWPDGEYIRLNLNPIMETHFTDFTPPDTATYWYYVTAIYSNNQWVSESFASEKDHGRADMLSISGDISQIPSQFFLSQNYPNPFNPTTSISYGLPAASHVRLEIFNIMGQKVAILIDSDQSAGYKKVIWDGKDNSGHQVSSGMYLYRLVVGEHVISHKMMLIK